MSMHGVCKTMHIGLGLGLRKLTMHKIYYRPIIKGISIVILVFDLTKSFSASKCYRK